MIAVEYLLSIVAALGDVMDHARNDDTRTSGHKSGVVEGGLGSHRKCVCPLFVVPFLSPFLSRPLFVFVPFLSRFSPPRPRPQGPAPPASQPLDRDVATADSCHREKEKVKRLIEP